MVDTITAINKLRGTSGSFVLNFIYDVVFTSLTYDMLVAVDTQFHEFVWWAVRACSNSKT